MSYFICTLTRERKNSNYWICFTIFYFIYSFTREWRITLDIYTSRYYFICSLAREGRILTIGYASGKIPSIPANLLLLKSGSAMGLFWGEYRIMNTPVFLKSVEDVLEQTRLGNITPHIGKEFPLNKV